MMGHRTTIIILPSALVVLIFVAATLAQAVPEDDTTNIFGPLEVTKGELESNRLYRKDVQLERPKQEEGGASPPIRIHDDVALAAVVGTRRRGSQNVTVSKYPVRRGCVTEGAVFAEGSAMVSPDECSYCFCIRGRQRCVAPKCLLPVEGCRPRYRTFSCCPSYYDCHDASTTTTTTTRTPRDCDVDGVKYAEGALIEGAGGDCENCYCLNGEVTCTRTTCAPPLDGCKPVMQEGQCCPVKYDCDDGNRRVSVDQFFKDFPVKITTADQSREFERMKPEWQTNMARKSPGGEAIIADPIEGQSFPESLTEAPLESPDTQAPPVNEKEEERPTVENDEESPSKPEDVEPNHNEGNGESPGKRLPGRASQRKRLSSMITRPSREDLANMRKQSRYAADRRPTFQRPRIQTQSLSTRLRQRIKQNKEHNRNDNNDEEPQPSSTSSTTTTTPLTSSTTTPLTSSTTTPLTSSTTTPLTSSTTTTPLTSSTTTTPLTSTTTTTTSSATTQTATILSSDSTTKSLLASTTQHTSENEELNIDTTIYDESDPVTDAYEDFTTLTYGPVPGILDTQDIYDPVTLDSDPHVDALLLKTISTAVETPTEDVLPVDISSTAAQVFEPTSTFAPGKTARASISRFTTRTTTTSTTTEEASLPEAFEFGHPGEVFLVDDISETTSPRPPRGSAFKINEQIAVGTGVNVKGNLEDAVRFGPILIFDNRVRTDRQQKEANETETEAESTPQDAEEPTATTDIPEETTILAREDFTNAEKLAIEETGLEGELSTDYDEGTEEVTTLLPTLALFQDTTVRSLSEILFSATESSGINETNSDVHVDDPSTALDDIEYHIGDETDYTDIETDFPSYDITVGTSVLANSQGPPQSTGIGEVIPVELEPEHKTPEIERPIEEAERPSLLGTILNILTRTERPRPEMPDNLPPPPPPPFRPPYRTRPRPDGRPNPRPDFVPPRLRFTPPPPLPPAASERDTTEEPDLNLPTSAPAPLTISTSRPSIFEPPPPPEPPKNVINRPVSGLNGQKPISNTPVHSSSHPDLAIRPDFIRPPTVANRPIALPPPPPPPPEIPHGLPSNPVIEGGFQGIRDEEGIPPNIDYDYDIDGQPTLPPSLPNLKIIPFVAADAVVNQEIGIAGDEFKPPPLLLNEPDDNNNDNQRSDYTTETPTTTSRRPPFASRPPILPPRRPIVRPGDESSSRRPFPFRRPGDRPTRPPFSTKTTAPATLIEDHPEEEEDSSDTRLDVPFANREHPSTRPPFIPPRRPTPIEEDSTTTATTSTTTTTTTTTTRRPPTLTTTPKTIVSEDIANLLLQDVFGLAQGQNTPLVRFTPARTTNKPIIPLKLSTALPEIPSAVKEQLPLATDPVLASGILKLSGCNIYGRMYNVGAKIKELSASCKECRCTPVGVQCLPIC